MNTGSSVYPLLSPDATAAVWQRLAAEHQHFYRTSSLPPARHLPVGISRNNARRLLRSCGRMARALNGQTLAMGCYLDPHADFNCESNCKA